MIEAFLAAARAGDFEALLEVLDPEVVFRTHGRAVARPPAVGAGAVARRILARGAAFAPYARPALVNGAAGLLVARGGRIRGVVAFTVTGGQIAAIDLVVDPDRLGELVIRD